jgi:hypothetical protein
MPFQLKAVPTAVLCLGMVTQAAAADGNMREALAKSAAVVDRCAKVEPLPGTPVVPGGSIFGFTDPTDLGDPCVWSFASENTGREGKRDGSYFALATKSEVSYTYTSNIAFAFSVFTAYTRWSNVTAVQEKLASEGDGVFLDRFNRLSFDGLSGEFLVRLLTRGPGQPVAVTASVEPRWSHVDFVTGFRADGYGAEFKLLTDFALAERLFGAVNLNYALGTQKFDIPNAEWERGSGINLSAALTACSRETDRRRRFRRARSALPDAVRRTVAQPLYRRHLQFRTHVRHRVRRRQGPHLGVEPAARRANVAGVAGRAQPHRCRPPRVPREV